MNLMRCIVVSAASLPVLLVATSCSGGGSSSENDGLPPVGSIKRITRDADISLPLDTYVPTAKELDDDAAAEQMLAQECMRRFELRYPRIFERPAKYPVARHEGLYGILNAQEAGRYGYGRPAAPGDDGRSLGDSKRKTREPTAVEANVWHGQGESVINGQKVPQGGCLAEGRRRLTSGQMPKVAPGFYAQQLGQEAYQRSQNDPRVKAVVEQWSACMRRAGFSYKDPFDANNDNRWADSLSEREITAAKTDIQCKHTTNVAGVWMAVQTAYEKKSIERNAEALNQSKSLFAIRQKNAALVLSGKAPV